MSLSRRLPVAGAVAIVALIGAVSASVAQDGMWRQFGEYGWFREPPRFPTDKTFDGSFTYCRGLYDSDRREAGGTGWRTDYPGADINFPIRLSELTKTRVGRDLSGEPTHVVVRLTDEWLFRCPFLSLEDVGTANFTEEEVKNLRAYLLKGGFLWVDDFWGERAWDRWVREIARVLPPSDYPIVDLPPDHPIFHTLFQVTDLPQIPSIQFWRQTGGLTSERGVESAVPDFRGISDSHGRLIVFITHDTDIADAWEREGEDPQFFYRFSGQGYAVGIDAMMYAMTH